MVAKAQSAKASKGLSPKTKQAAELASWGQASPRDYFSLLKPRVMVLVIFTAAMGMLAASRAGGDIHPFIAFTALLAISLGAGGAGALNMWYEASLDGAMARTAKRPLPSGVIPRSNGLGVGVVASLFAVSLLFLATNLAAALWLAATIGFYLFIYTIWLKPRTPQNIVIGGLAGALPPLVGWVAMSGGEVSLYPVLMVAIIFFWTPPHSWALALFTGDDYKNARIPMLPVVKGKAETCRQILLWTVVMLVVGLTPFMAGFSGVGYALVATLGGLAMLYYALMLYLAQRAGSDLIVPSKATFNASLVYLPLLFAAIGAGI